ncbi:hypothetical protein [Halorussus litoreus]|uniref:hypothetical protein n=1 Tax=Halorussus litoreus TaxID=1710536 RepID=UPI000E26BB62|nr:hypothetical protein [Halorussus litoreus]
MRRTTGVAFAVALVAVAAVVLVTVGAAVLVPTTPVGALSVEGVDGVGTPDGEKPALVEVGDDRLWPYVGPERSFDRPASSINVVVRTDPASVREYLADERSWNRSAGGDADDSRVADAATDPPVDAERVPWLDAPGAPRYTYVDGEGWLAERYQLHRGSYFGARYHLRAYGPPNGDWTAVQAHAEHWDWFTITHTVDSVETAQIRVETGFLGESAFAVRRVNYDNGDTYDADGWATVVALSLAPLLARGRLRLRPTARNVRRLALAGTLAALPLVVRAGGILFERHLPWLSTDAVVAIWYPVLVAGIPLAAYRLGRRLPATEAGALAGVGVGVGVVLDYACLEIAVLPIPVAVHRVAVVAAGALLAAGAASRGDDGNGESASDDEGEGATARWPSTLRLGAVFWVAVVIGGHLV